MKQSSRRKGASSKIKKKQVHHKRPNQLKASYLLFIALLGLVLVLAISQTNLANSFFGEKAAAPIPQKKIKTQVATPSANLIKVASPSAAVKPKVASPPAVVIPQNYGKSITVPVLYYHYIGNNPNPADTLRDSLSITPDRFEAEMAYLSQNGYNTITPDSLYADLKAGTSPGHAVLLTFDDGYIDFYINAFPILRRYNIHATVFIPTGLVGGSYYLTWDQIKEMDSSGLITFEAHSVNHVNLAGMSGDRLKFQVYESKKVLESQLGHPVNFFAYPYGTSNAETWQVVKEAGFLGAWGTWYGRVESEGRVYNMPRERMGGSVDLPGFIAKL